MYFHTRRIKVLKPTSVQLLENNSRAIAINIDIIRKYRNKLLQKEREYTKNNIIESILKLSSGQLPANLF